MTLSRIGFIGACGLLLAACGGVNTGNLFGNESGTGLDGGKTSSSNTSTGDNTGGAGGAGGGGGGAGGSGGAGGTRTSGTGGEGGCVPKTCRDYNFNCGEPEDGCGNVIECGSCSAVEFCDIGVCTKSACQVALEDATTIPGLNQTETDSYLAVLNCVCHDPATSSVCGSNLESQTMCGNNGWNTGNITQDFLDNNPIGSCCSMQCDIELAGCREQL